MMRSDLSPSVRDIKLTSKGVTSAGGILAVAEGVASAVGSKQVIKIPLEDLHMPASGNASEYLLALVIYIGIQRVGK